MELNPANWIRDSRVFVGEVRQEFRKVTWPSQREYVGGTIGVMVIVTIVTVVLGFVDFGLRNLVAQVLG